MKTPSIAIAALFLLASPARADDAQIQRAAPAFPRWIVHLTPGVNVYTYLGPTDKARSAHVTPDQKVTLSQQIGVGYYLRRDLSLRVGLNFAEVAYGPTGASAFSSFGTTPWLVYSTHGFYVGAGPYIGIRTYGANNADLGIWAASGYSFPVGGPVYLAVGVSMTSMFLQRVYVGLNPSVSLAFRF